MGKFQLTSNTDRKVKIGTIFYDEQRCKCRSGVD